VNKPFYVVCYKQVLLLSFDKMVEKGIDAGLCCKIDSIWWEVITEALKQGGITAMMDRLSNPAKLKAFELSQKN
jgi:ketol-acid reductoisomerase